MTSILKEINPRTVRTLLLDDQFSIDSVHTVCKRIMLRNNSRQFGWRFGGREEGGKKEFSRIAGIDIAVRVNV